LYGILFDCDGWAIYANRSALENPEHMRNFKAKYGYDLGLPKTMEQFLDISEFFGGWDWDGDGEVEYGNVMPLVVGGQLAFWFQSWIGSYITLPGPVVDDYHNTTWFNPGTMEPAINTPGAVKALEDFVKLSKSAPKGSLGWDLAQAWDYFLKGNSALCINPGDIGSLAQDPERSTIQGKLLTGPMPGRYEVWNRETNRWQKYDEPVMVGNTIGCSWHGVISRLSKSPDAAYHFLAYIAQRERLEHLTYEGWTGVDIGKIYDFPPEVSNGNGTGTLQGYLDAGYDRDDALSYLKAYWDLYYEADTSQEYLRIPGAVQMLDSFDKHVSAALSGMETPKAAMDAIYDEWNAIVDTLGRDTLKVYYQDSIGYGKAPPKYYK
jgi:multiple sugar transport system substrate-binding protein